MNLMPRISHMAVAQIRGKLVKLLPYTTVIRACGKPMMNKIRSREGEKSSSCSLPQQSQHRPRVPFCGTIATRTRKDNAFAAARRQWEAEYSLSLRISQDHCGPITAISIPMTVPCQDITNPPVRRRFPNPQHAQYLIPTLFDSCRAHSRDL